MLWLEQLAIASTKGRSGTQRLLLFFYNLYCKSSLVKTLFVHGVLFSICSYNSSPRLSINMSLRKCWETHFTPSLHRKTWEIKLKSTSPVVHMWPTEPGRLTPITPGIDIFLKFNLVIILENANARQRLESSLSLSLHWSTRPTYNTRNHQS